MDQSAHSQESGLQKMNHRENIVIIAAMKKSIVETSIDTAHRHLFIMNENVKPTMVIM